MRSVPTLSPSINARSASERGSGSPPKSSMPPRSRTLHGSGSGESTVSAEPLIPSSDARRRPSWLHEGMHEQVEGGFGAWYRRHRWWADPLGMAIFAVVMAAFGFRGIWGPFSLLQEPLSPWWALVLALPACAIALFKRRMPVTVLVLVSLLFVADLLTVGGLGTLVVLLDVLWTAAFLADSRGRRMLLVLLGAATVVLFLCAWLLTDVSFPVAFLIGVQFGAIFGTDYWWAVAVSQAHELAELHRQRAEHAAAVAERDRVEAVQRERETMARELHDVVAGHVMAMAIRAEAALSTPPDPPRDREALQAVRDAGLDAHAALRSMISVLRRGEGSPASSPRWGDLEGIVQEAERAGLTVRLVADHVGDVGSALEQAVIRIVREALNNCIRHASGAEVDVIIRRSGPEVRVEVRSRGGSPSGASTSADGGWGLQMLRERVAALGAPSLPGRSPADGRWKVASRRRQRHERADGAAGGRPRRDQGGAAHHARGAGDHGGREAADGDVAVRNAAALRPDVVLMDLRMPGRDGISATAEIVERHLSDVLVLTSFDEDDLVFGAIRAGAVGFLLKTVDAPTLGGAVRAIAAGEGALDPRVTRRALAAVAESAAVPAQVRRREGMVELTAREQDVLDGILQGWSNAQLAARLRISVPTVKTHVSNVLTKLGARSRSHAAALVRGRDD